jgi:hypothetical protein
MAATLARPAARLSAESFKGVAEIQRRSHNTAHDTTIQHIFFR